MKLEDVHEGMVLKQEIRSPFGNVLLKRGVMLSRKHLVFLRNWGLAEVEVIPCQKEGKNSASTHILNGLAQLDILFEPFVNDTYMRQLKRDIWSFIMKYLDEIQ